MTEPSKTEFPVSRGDLVHVNDDDWTVFGIDATGAMLERLFDHHMVFIEPADFEGLRRSVIRRADGTSGPSELDPETWPDSDPSKVTMLVAQRDEFRRRAVESRAALEQARTAWERGDIAAMVEILRRFTGVRP